MEVKFNYPSMEGTRVSALEVVELLQQVLKTQAVTAFLGVEHRRDILLGFQLLQE